ncbi:hypothetical protein C8R43DRAFT_1122699 [Mycena crocata]|nr:hypothetical protein C8R43DRAFT_1122699 [Mycena crocata]
MSRKRRRKAATMEDDGSCIVGASVADFMAGPSNAPIQTRVEWVSQDGRRTYGEPVFVRPPTPVKKAQTDALGANETAEPTTSTDGHADHDRYRMDLGGFFDEPPPPPRRSRGNRKFRPSDKVLYEWRTLRDEFVAELLRLDGAADASEDVCPSCGTEKPTIRCRDCFGELLYCKSCVVERHEDNPLHFVDEWDGALFSRTTLRDLGLRIQLGHKGCSRPVAGNESFVVLDLPHIHEMLRRRWYPASHEIPKSAATFRCLDFFLTVTHQAKTTMYNFYTALERATDGTGRRPPIRYREFLRMVRQFRHLLMLKQAGRGHDPSGVYGTKPGGLAIECPACPWPDVNLPDGWEDAPPEMRYIYTSFLAFDACFRLKRRMISSFLRDPGLGTGWGYFTEYEPFREYLLTVTDQDEMSTCSGLAALDYANTKFSRGYSSTGVGMGVCARHEFVQPTGVADLQKGERYANMDWVFASIMRWKHERLRKVLSYDIICQWYKALFLRMGSVPMAVGLLFLEALFHAGQTDGEGIERPWASIGAVATSTREMGPGSRFDTLDSHWAFWNWSKLITIAALLRRRLDNATAEKKSQTEALDAFSLEQAEHVPTWRKMVEDWEKDPKGCKNPFEATQSGLTEAQVRLQLSQEEQELAASGVPSLHDVSPSSFIYAGLELEDQQRRLRIQAKLKKAQTTAQKIDLIGMRRRLLRGIVRFRKLQATYTPAALQALARRPADPKEQPESTPLMLPSALSSEERAGGCMAIEGLARDAQCGAALVRLRNQLHVKSRLMRYKKSHSRNQGANTRSRTLVVRNEAKIGLHSEKYQMAWHAMSLLQNGDAGKIGWRKLRKEDIGMMQDAEELSKRAAKRKKQRETARARQAQLQEEGDILPSQIDQDEDDWVDVEDDGEAAGPTSENRRQVSWIWTMAGTTGSDAELHEALRIEWGKAYARTRRWSEEVALLNEEFRRVLISFEYEALKWEGRIKVIDLSKTPLATAQGAIAYGLKQAAMWRDLAERAKVTMSELHLGKGKKRRPRQPASTERQDNVSAHESGSESDTESENDSDVGMDIHSDEEHFLGGDEDLD